MEKSVLLLGASSDVAKALAYEYASNGYSILLSDRNGTYANDLSNDISIRFGVTSMPYKLDICDTDSHQRFLEQLAYLPAITICLIGYLGDHDKAKSSWQEANKIISTNYVGVASILNLIADEYERREQATNTRGHEGVKCGAFYS